MFRVTPTSDSLLRFGLITDLHYADKETAGTRFYRDTLGKLEEASAEFTKDKIEFVVELGDLIDAADSVQVELGYLKTINKTFAAICKDRHYVLGNHCVDTLTKQEFWMQSSSPSRIIRLTVEAITLWPGLLLSKRSPALSTKEL